MTNLAINKKDVIVMKILHYFVTEENYKPIVVTGIQNEIWLENLEQDVKLIRVNINYIHNKEQYYSDLRKANVIRKTIKKKTYSLDMKMFNILVDSGENVKPEEKENIETIKVDKISDLKKNNLLTAYYPKIKDKLSTKKTNMAEMFKMTDELNKKTEREEKRLAKTFKANLPVVTYALIALNVIIYVLMLQPSIYVSFINHFANYYVNVGNGEIYRLITAVFLHANVSHIFFNMYALYKIGPEIERYYGKLKYIAIFLISGIVGCLFSCVLNTTASIGASGAIFGLFGALLYFGFNYRATLDNYLRGSIIPLILINLLIGFLVPGIDIVAHIGGFIGGYLISMACGIKDKNKKRDKINGYIMFAILISFLTYLLLVK